MSKGTKRDSHDIKYCTLIMKHMITYMTSILNTIGGIGFIKAYNQVGYPWQSPELCLVKQAINATWLDDHT